MSGSPVYIDGRLIGAVSYSLGSFSKEPIAGITPIAEMTDATTLSEAQSVRGARACSSIPADARESHRGVPPRAQLEPAVRRSPERRATGRRQRRRRRSPTAGRHAAPADCDAARDVRASSPTSPTCSARRSATRGSCPTGGSARGAGAGEMPFEGPLKPGDAVGVSFLTGDMEMGATGTVTHIDGDRVYAFGHPMYNLGPTEFPMTRAYVYTVLPSLVLVAQAVDDRRSHRHVPAGSRDGDRRTAGPGPRMIPITLTLESPRGAPRTFHFSVVNDQLFTPLMSYQRAAEHAALVQTHTAPAPTR